MSPHYLNSGQRRCWDGEGRECPCAGSGQDAEFEPGERWPKRRFVSGNQVVEDRLTGLTWLMEANPFEWPLSWTEGLQAVKGLCHDRHLGFADWRMPNRLELWSLISFAGRDPALPGGHGFRNVVSSWYWSSTSAARNPAYAWSIQLTGGRVFYESKERYALTWPCRGQSHVLPASGQTAGFDAMGRPIALSGSGQDGEGVTGAAWPAPRFEAHHELVIDHLTGLVWSRVADRTTGPADWQGALRAAGEMNTSERIPRTRWRLPTITELASLLDMSRCDPTLPGEHPFREIGAGYWSSTSSSYDPKWAMVLHLNRGAIGVGLKQDPRYLVWPVAGP